MTSTVEPTSSEIRRVALEMFSAHGYHGTSVRDIARAVGIRGSSMYHHFPSKEAILWELTADAFTQLHETRRAEADRLPPSATPVQRLEAFVRSDVRYHARHREEASIINAQIGSLAPAHRAAAVERRAEYESILTEIVHDCVGPGRAADPKTRLIIYAILQMSAAVAVWYRPDGPLDVEDICTSYALMAAKLVH